MNDVYIYDAIRTPRGKGKETGSLYSVRPIDLLAGLLSAVPERNNIDSKVIEDVICGTVTQTGEQGGCLAKFAALVAGYNERVPGVMLNRFCGSGLDAIRYAAALVGSGLNNLVLAGGLESMSRVKMGSDEGALFDPATQWKSISVPQGISADLLATVRGISRQDVDEFAVASHQRAAKAAAGKQFSKSLVPVYDCNQTLCLDYDENVRPDTTSQKLLQLKPSFETVGTTFGLDFLTKHRYPQVENIQHVHTAGNSSGIVDGAAMVLMGSKSRGESLGLKPKARIRAVSVTACDPVVMLEGVVPTTELVLQKAGMKISDIDLFEVNEAFAAVPLWFMRYFNVPHDKVNIHGGAIALGHPLGATGAMLVGTLIDALSPGGIGLATLCIGGGMGISAIIERV